MWAVLKHDMPYVDLGADHFDKIDEETIAGRAISRLKALGYEVTATKTA